jgi:hypothetical protein
MPKIKPDQTNYNIGKFLFQKKLLSKPASNIVDINKPRLGLAELGRLFIKEFVINKNFGWLQTIAKEWEDLKINKK